MSGFEQLVPELILDAVGLLGARPEGSLTPLNSYENRVYEIAMNDGPSVIAKFYRPERWSFEAIADEHHFVLEAAKAGVPVVAPLRLQHAVGGTQTIGDIDGYYCAFYPKMRGRQSAEVTNDQRKVLGKSLAKLHQVGARLQLNHRLLLDPESYGYASLDVILDDYVPERLERSLEQILLQAIRLCEPFFRQGFEVIATHGDCHWGNILWQGDEPLLLDFDDAVMAPPVQDAWMLFHGSSEDVREQRQAFLDGYESVREFPTASFVLSEPLRTLRMIHHAAWIGQRYDEEAFQRAFPYYRDDRYWEQLLLGLKEQVSLLQDALNS